MSPSPKRINGVLAISLCAAMFAGCSGGGVGRSAMQPQSQSPVLTTQSTQSTQAAKGNVSFAIGIRPKTKTGRITPNYVSPSTQSLRVLTDGANPVVVNLTRYSPNCSPNLAVPGAYTCTASLSVPAGNHVFTVTTYDLTGGEGNVLSTNSTGAVYVKPTGTTTVSLVLEGVVRHVILILATMNPPVGKAATIGLTAILEDGDGNLIVGPAPYQYPVMLTTTDATNGLLSKTALTSPTDTLGITVSYSGAKVASITYSATAIGLPDGNVVKEVLTPGAPPTKRQHLFVASAGGNSVSVFDTAHGNAPLAAITGGGLSSATDLAIDASGVLYVANNYGSTNDCNDGCVLVFDTAHGNAALSKITAAGGGLDYPTGVAVDASGKLYVASQVHDSVSVFDTTRGNAALPVITGGLNNPFGVAVDASGKLYVANFGNNTVSVFDTVHGNAVLPAITGAGLNSPIGVAVDASGKLYVASQVHDSVLIFDTAHGNAVLPAITAGLKGPAELALDGSGKLYVANEGNSTVSVFDTAHGNAALPVITVGASGVAVDASGKL